MFLERAVRVLLEAGTIVTFTGNRSFDSHIQGMDGYVSCAGKGV